MRTVPPCDQSLNRQHGRMPRIFHGPCPFSHTDRVAQADCRFDAMRQALCRPAVARPLRGMRTAATGRFTTATKMALDAGFAHKYDDHIYERMASDALRTAHAIGRRQTDARSALHNSLRPGRGAGTKDPRLAHASSPSNMHGDGGRFRCGSRSDAGGIWGNGVPQQAGR